MMVDFAAMSDNQFKSLYQKVTEENGKLKMEKEELKQLVDTLKKSIRSLEKRLNHCKCDRMRKTRSSSVDVKEEIRWNLVANYDGENESSTDAGGDDGDNHILPIDLSESCEIILREQEEMMSDGDHENSEKTPIKRRNRKTHICDWIGCTYQTKRMDFYRLHCATHRGEDVSQFKCTECEKVFPNDFLLRQHIKSHARGARKGKPIPPYMMEPKHPCPECGKKFYKPNLMRAHHSRIHLGEKPFKCPEPDCDHATTTKQNLLNHMRKHTGEKPFTCR